MATLRRYRVRKKTYFVIEVKSVENLPLKLGTRIHMYVQKKLYVETVASLNSCVGVVCGVKLCCVWCCGVFYITKLIGLGVDVSNCKTSMTKVSTLALGIVGSGPCTTTYVRP